MAGLALAQDQKPVDRPAVAPAASKSATVPAKPAPAGQPESKQPENKSAGEPASGAGVTVFIDPTTGAIRQPDASEIGTLVGMQTGPAPKIPAAPVVIYGPGNAVGLRLVGGQSSSYMVASRAPDDKLATDCVTGEKAAVARVGTGQPGTGKGTPEGKGPGDVHR